MDWAWLIYHPGIKELAHRIHLLAWESYVIIIGRKLQFIACSIHLRYLQSDSQEESNKKLERNAELH